MKRALLMALFLSVMVSALLLSCLPVNAQNLKVESTTGSIGPGQTKVLELNVDGRVNINTEGHQEIWALVDGGSCNPRTGQECGSGWAYARIIEAENIGIGTRVRVQFHNWKAGATRSITLQVRFATN